MREGPSFGAVYTTIIDPSVAVYVPRGVGNSYQTLEPNTAYTYLVNDHWSPDATYTFLNLADETAAVDWPIPRSLLYCGCFHDLALRLNLNTAAILASINQQLSQTREHDTSGVQQALKEAFFYGLVNDFQLVDTECLLAGLYYSNHLIREIFFTHGMSESEFTDWQRDRKSVV